MAIYGLIGFPLDHSWSQRIFSEKFKKEGIDNARYEMFPVSTIGILPDLIRRNPELRGLNVTSPYKTAVIPYLHRVDGVALHVGAVNTIKIHRDQDQVQLVGFNTDVVGFQAAVARFLKPGFTRSLILGTGGAARAVGHVFDTLGIGHLMVSRNPGQPGQIRYTQLTAQMVRESQIIVNATPAGQYPNPDMSPDIPYHALNPDHLVVDLIYNPPQTVFLKRAQEQGAVVLNGMTMLRFQAEEAWRIWARLEEDAP